MENVSYIKIYNRRQLPGDSDRLEIIVSLFTECNLKCEFCGDRYRQLEKPSKQGINLRISHIKTVVHRLHPKHIDFKIFGGELFQDKYNDDIFSMYDMFIGEVVRICNDAGITYNLDISTNAVYKQIDRVISFLKKWNIAVRCSYDVEGRFTKQYQKDLYFRNIALFKSAGIETSIAVILTSQLVDVVTNSNNPLHEEWDFLYNTYNISVDYYDPIDLLPEEGISKQHDHAPDKYLLNEKQHYDFLIYCLDHYPQIELVREFTVNFQSNSRQCKHCIHGVAITTNIYWECCDLYKISCIFVNKKKCFQCKYFNICPGTCNRIFYNSDVDYCYINKFFELLYERSISQTDK
jgi:sulfatase maturation enzyme AslB (radical SAM superfamily)